MSIDIDTLLAPPTPTAARAREVVRRWASPAILHHSIRSWAWARALGLSIGLDHDAELLYVAAMLHDLGVTPHFDAHATAFESAGGATGAVFAAGAGWSDERQGRVQQIIERHMWVSVDPDLDAEGHLLEVATSLDVSGAAPERWDAGLLRAVTSRHPRGSFSADFTDAIRAQAARKPETAAARLDGSGRIATGAEVWARILDETTAPKRR